MFQLRIYGAITETVSQFFSLSKICAAIIKMKPKLNNNTGYLHAATLQFVVKIFLLILGEKYFYEYSGRGKFMPLPLKRKILENPGSLVTDDIKMFPL
jgi:hypothetical protein